MVVTVIRPSACLKLHYWSPQVKECFRVNSGFLGQIFSKICFDEFSCLTRIEAGLLADDPTFAKWIHDYYWPHPLSAIETETLRQMLLDFLTT